MSSVTECKSILGKKTYRTQHSYCHTNGTAVLYQIGAMREVDIHVYFKMITTYSFIVQLRRQLQTILTRGFVYLIILSDV